MYIYGPSALERSVKSIKKSPNHPKLQSVPVVFQVMGNDACDIQYASQPHLWYIFNTITYLVDHPQISDITSLCLDRNNCISIGESVTPALGVTPSRPDRALLL
jgi:hypothetical protein